MMLFEMPSKIARKKKVEPSEPENKQKKYCTKTGEGLETWMDINNLKTN